MKFWPVSLQTTAHIMLHRLLTSRQSLHTCTPPTCAEATACDVGTSKMPFALIAHIQSSKMTFGLRAHIQSIETIICHAACRLQYYMQGRLKLKIQGYGTGRGKNLSCTSSIPQHEKAFWVSPANTDQHNSCSTRPVPKCKSLTLTLITASCPADSSASLQTTMPCCDTCSSTVCKVTPRVRARFALLCLL